MKRILFILLLTIPFIGFGQGWEKTYGKNNSNCYSGSVKETTDGGYIILGRYNEEFGTGNSGTWLIKTNSSGDSIWTKDYNGGGFGSVEQTNDSGYILLGGSDKLIKTVPMSKNSEISACSTRKSKIINAQNLPY